MELVNTHCHCVYSGHGVGSVAEYADAAAAADLTTLAFTEHFPLSAAFDPDRYLSMTEENLPRYLAEIEQARAAHPSVEFIVGTEMDYLGDLEDRALDEAALLHLPFPSLDFGCLGIINIFFLPEFIANFLWPGSVSSPKFLPL